MIVFKLDVFGKVPQTVQLDDLDENVKLDKLRERLISSKMMQAGDWFIIGSAGSLDWIDAEREKGLALANAMDKTTRHLRVLSRRMRVTVQGGRKIWDTEVSVGGNIATLRVMLEDDQVMTKEDRFLEGEKELDPSKEKDKKIALLIDDKSTITIKATTPTERDVTVQKGTNKWNYDVKVSDNVATLRARLKAAGHMNDGDKFLVKDGELTEETGKTIASLIDDKSIITIKAASGWTDKLPDKTPTATATLPTFDPTKTLLPKDWGNFDSASLKLPDAPKSTVPTTLTSESNTWKSIDTENKLYIFSALQLGRGIRVPGTKGPSGDLEAEEGKLSLGNNFAVMIHPIDHGNGVEEPDAKAPTGIEKDYEEETKTTYSKQTFELRKRGVTSASASAGGFGVAVTAKMQQSEEKLRKGESSTCYLTHQVYIPKVKVTFHPKSGEVKATEKFTSEVRAALGKTVTGDLDPLRSRYRALLDVLNNFGHFFPAEFTIGGSCILYDSKVVNNQAEADAFEQSFSVGVAAETPKIKAGAEAGHATSTQTATTSQSVTSTTKVTFLGGETGTFSKENLGQWQASIRSYKNWRIVGLHWLTPTIAYLPDDLKKECLALIHAYSNDPDTREKTVLDMKEYIRPLEEERVESFF